MRRASRRAMPRVQLQLQLPHRWWASGATAAAAALLLAVLLPAASAGAEAAVLDAAATRQLQQADIGAPAAAPAAEPAPEAASPDWAPSPAGSQGPELSIPEQPQPEDISAPAATPAPEAAPEAAGPDWAPSPAASQGPQLSVAEQPQQGAGQQTTPEQPPPEQAPGQQQPGGGLPWALLFSDEFDGPSLDQNKWSYLIGQGYEYGLPGFSNGEVQYYSSNPENVRVENNLLILQARQSDPGNPWSSTSGRITTLDKFSVCPTPEFPTIRIEARVKVPQGAALWPAFWMLPQVGAWSTSSCIGCGKYGHWAASGEIDIMETANDMRTAHGTLHFGSAWPGNAQTGGEVTLESGSLADNYHVFALEWEADQMRWYIDTYNFFVARPASVAGEGQGWWTAGEGAGPSSPFDTPFFLILNLAVGGPNTVFTGGAPLGDTLAQPQQMMVDYVRVHGLPYALSKAQQ